MKKLILLILAVSLFNNSFSQKIVVDKVNEHGERFVFCSEKFVTTLKDMTKISVSLHAAQKSDDAPLYSILIRILKVDGSPFSMPKGSRFLIKLTDDSVIELKSREECPGELKIDRTVNGWVKEIYEATPSFDITKEQLLKVFSGVKKVRFETSLDNIDKEFDKDKIGVLLKKEFDLINEALSKEKDFSSDF